MFINIYGISDNNRDSLLKDLNKTKHDTIKIATLIRIAYSYEYVKPDSAVFYSKLAVNLSNKIKNFDFLIDAQNTLGSSYSYLGLYQNSLESYLIAYKIADSLNIKSKISLTLNNLGYAYENIGLFDKALEYYVKSLNIELTLKNKEGIAYEYLGIGNIYNQKGDYPKALDYLFKSLKIREEIGNKSEIAATLLSIGSLYYSIFDYKKALEYDKKVLAIQKEINNKNGICSVLQNIGIIYEATDDPDSALIFYDQYLTLSTEIGDQNGIANAYNSIAGVFYNKGDLNKSIEYLKKCLEIKTKIGDIEGVCNGYSNMGSLYDAMGNIPLAIKYHIKSYEMALADNSKEPIQYSAKTLSVLYAKQNQFQKAYEFQLIYQQMTDSLINEDNIKKITQLGMQYDFDKIQKEEEFKKLQIDIQHKAEITRQRFIRNTFIIGFLLMIILAFVIFRSYKIKRRDNKILEQKNIEITQQKEEISTQRDEIEAQRDEIEAQRDLVTIQKEHIEEIHKDVTDSINYAERIQRSFLANKKLLEENLSEHFVIFHPKDVVSGDFYWASILKDGKFAISIADSTGHGVPGAIMSILNISSLEKAVELGFCNSSEILNHTRNSIIERLKKDGSVEGGKDGMDASLICFDFANKKFIYSAANNPIWVIRNNELIELKPDKMPVGKHEKDQIPFTQNEFTLLKNDLIYVFTDGLPDQFGGPKGKKFLYKQFKELLVRNSHKSMHEQGIAIDEAFINWKGENEQIDDVTVVGIRI